MKTKKSIITLVIALTLMLMSTVGVYAVPGDPVTVAGGSGETEIMFEVEATNFDARLPFQFLVQQAADGTITTPNSGIVAIENHNALGGMVVVGLEIVEANGWELVDFTSDFANMKVNAKSYGFQINNENVDPTTRTVALAEENWGVIPNGGSLPITYDAGLPGQSSAVALTKVGGVIFTVDFDKVVEVTP